MIELTIDGETPEDVQTDARSLLGLVDPSDALEFDNPESAEVAKLLDWTIEAIRSDRDGWKSNTGARQFIEDRYGRELTSEAMSAILNLLDGYGIVENDGNRWFLTEEFGEA